MAELSTMVLNNVKRFYAFSPLLVSSKNFTFVNLKTAQVIAFDNVRYIQKSFFPDVLHDTERLAMTGMLIIRVGVQRVYSLR